MIPAHLTAGLFLGLISLSVFVGSVNEKVPLSSSWHRFCLPARIDWDAVQDEVDRLMLLPCFLTLLKNAGGPPRGARLQLFSNPPSFKSASPRAPLGSDVEIPTGRTPLKLSERFV